MERSVVKEHFSYLVFCVMTLLGIILVYTLGALYPSALESALRKDLPSVD